MKKAQDKVKNRNQTTMDCPAPEGAVDWDTWEQGVVEEKGGIYN